MRITQETPPLLNGASKLLALVVAEITRASTQMIVSLLCPCAEFFREQLTSKNRSGSPDHPTAVKTTQRSRHRFSTRNTGIVDRFVLILVCGHTSDCWSEKEQSVSCGAAYQLTYVSNGSSGGSHPRISRQYSSTTSASIFTTPLPAQCRSWPFRLGPETQYSTPEFTST